jgi:hypothetical protein
MRKLSSDLLRQAMAQIGSHGGKTAARMMTPEQRRARAKKASEAAAKKRTAERLAREKKARRK